MKKTKDDIAEVMGESVNGNDDHWIVECPRCSKELEFKGFFDSGDINECSCGTKFKTIKVWLNEDTFIK